MSLSLTVIIPVYNRAHCVLRTLDSVFASSQRPRQLLVVDNGSSDGSYDVCCRWADEHQCEDMSVRVLCETKPGAPAARNRGLDECQTDFVCFFDSDDLFDAGLVADAEVVLEQDPTTDLLCVRVLQDVKGKRHSRYFNRTQNPFVHILSSMLSTLSMIFRTEWLRGIGGWDERLTVWQDWELGLRALLHQPRVQWLDHRAYHCICVHGDSITGTSFTQTMRGTLCAMDVAMEQVGKVHEEDVRSRCLRALYFRSLIMAGMLQRERNAEGVQAYGQLACHCLPRPSRIVRWMGRFLNRYVVWGGRGAWWLALQAV